MSAGLIVILVGVFVAVAALAGVAASAVISATAPERRRLFAATSTQGLSTLPELMTLSSDSADPDAWQRLGALLPRSKKDMTKLRLRMQRAGFRQPSRAATIYTFVELVMPLVAAGIAMLLLAPPRAYFAAALGAAAMFFGPGLIVERRLSTRRREIENGLPDALDLLVVCIEAGSGLDQAIVKTAEELTVAYPNLAEELRILTAEIRAGKPRLDAFKSLASRTKVDDVRALVAMLIQTDKFGTSVGQALRTHADVSRSKRRQRAEERAQKVGVKLVFPLVLCFFPALYVVLLGPAVITFMHEFMHK
jgi:tight adherence protein C